MQPKGFYIPTTWRIKGRVEQVYDVLSRPREFPHWWPEVYLDVTLLEPVFVWNHKWAMQRGFEGLKRELARQAAP